MNAAPYAVSPWRLEGLLESTDTDYIDHLKTELENSLKEIETNRKILTDDISPVDFAYFLSLYERSYRLVLRLECYATLWFDADTQSQDALSFKGQMDQLYLEAQNRPLFFSLWWKALDDAAADRLLAEAGDLTYYLKKMRTFKPYTLSESEEKLINLKNVNGVDAIVTLYDMLTNNFSYTLNLKGEEKTMTREELTNYIRSPKADLRQSAYDELYRVYGEQANILAQMYTHRVRDWANEQMQLRDFQSPIAVRNLMNDIPDGVVDTLLDVVAGESKVFHRYFRLKAKWLGVEQLRRYDLYAPLNTSEKHIDYPQAVDMVLDTLHSFSPILGGYAQRVFADQHIDSEVRLGKRGGAFCASVFPELTPYVLMNYTGNVRDVATLAHELGHAIHSMAAAEHSVFTFHAPLPLAETASVFSEMLLTDRLLQEESDPAVQRDLLVTALDDAYATVLRQTYFVLFEKEAHRLILEGKTFEELNAAYLANLQHQFGDVFEIADVFKWEWICVPHIYHMPFYCYAYSFGQLLVLALYQQYKNEGQSFIPRYLKILAYGGSASPSHILTEAGIDMGSADFWRGGFRVLEGMVDDLEAIG